MLALPQVTCFFNVEIGKDITLDELKAHHHAIIWSAGATSDRPLGVPGEQLPGCHAAREFVAWYNGHPDQAGADFDLTGGHVVIIGNGYVAIDAARMLMRHVDELDRTDMAHHAIAALRTSNVREVTLAARRGPADAAYSLPELLALTHLDGVSLVARPEEVPPRPAGYGRNPLRLEIVEQAARARPLEPRRINLRYFLSPVSINGKDRVESVTFMRNAMVDEHGVTRLRPTGETETIETSLVLRAIGYRGQPVPGLPFDEKAGTIANVKGRVIDPETGTPVAGFYCAGWIKRGATGVVGTNKRCSAETVDSLLDDFAAGRTLASRMTGQHLVDLITKRAPHSLNFAGWARLDAAELREGKSRRRARSKFVTLGDMLAAAGCGG